MNYIILGPLFQPMQVKQIHEVSLEKVRLQGLKFTLKDGPGFFQSFNFMVQLKKIRSPLLSVN